MMSDQRDHAGHYGLKTYLALLEVKLQTDRPIVTLFFDFR